MDFIDLTKEEPQRHPRPRLRRAEFIDLVSSDEEARPHKKRRADDGPAEKHDCPICLEPIQPAFLHTLVGCRHPFCMECLRGFVSSKVADRTFPILCPLPGCGRAITTAECGLVLNAEEQVKLGQMEAESAIPTPQRIFCPNPACSQLLLLEGVPPRDTQQDCPYCARPLCPRCKVAWHSGMNCWQYQGS